VSPNLVATPEKAPSPAPRIIVQCPKLEEDPEHLAAFEARILVDLSLRQAKNATLLVVCNDPTARLSFQSESSNERRKLLKIPSEPEAFVDALLASVWQLISTDAPAARGTAVVSPPPAPKPAAGPGWHVGPELGVSGEVWQDPFSSWLGPDVGLSLRSGRLVLGLRGSARFASTDPRGVRAAAYGAGALGRWQVVGPLQAGAALQGLGVVANAAPDLSPASQVALSVVARFSSELVFPVAHLHVSVGPELNLYLLRPSLRVDGAEVGGPPRATVGAAARATF